jgi:colanic acid biosynthesis glycosyl transferase WcaI
VGPWKTGYRRVSDSRAGDPPSASLSGHHICIYSIYYEPEATGIAPYTTGLAEHLVGRGASVEVVTGFPHYPNWRLFPSYERGFGRQESVRGVKVVRCRQFTPRRHNGPSRACYEISWFLSGLTHRPKAADLVIGITPNLAGAALAWRAAARARAPLGLLVQDLTGPAASQSGITGGAVIPRLAGRLEGTMLRRADRVAVVSEGFVPYLSEVGVPVGRVHEVRNWTRVIPASMSKDVARASADLPLHSRLVLHAGNMGAKQALDSFVEAARLAEAVHPDLHFVIMGDGNQRERLEAAAGGLHNLSILPPRYGDAYFEALSAADVLVVNERASVRDMSLPSKLTSYFMSGRPVLAAVRSDGATARELERAGAGFVVAPEDPGALLAGVCKLVGDRDLADSLASSARTYATTALSASSVLQAADHFVDRLLGVTSTGGIGAGPRVRGGRP